MMNSYHYCYYYCYDYDDYPSCCCCSILLDDFLSLDEHDLLHLEPCLVVSVPQKDNSNGEQPPTHCLLLALLCRTSRHHLDATPAFMDSMLDSRDSTTILLTYFFFITTIV